MKELKKEFEEKLKDVLRFYGHNYYKAIVFHKDDEKMDFWFENLDKKTIPKLVSICKSEIEDAKPKWISVKDKLPEVGEKILVAIDSGWVILTGRLMTNGWTAFYSDGEELVSQDKDSSQVTHWMPLPEAPELKEKL